MNLRAGVLIGVVAMLLASAQPSAQQPAAPQILLEPSPRAVEYQLARLTNASSFASSAKPTTRGIGRCTSRC